MKLRTWLDENKVTALDMGARIGLEQPNSIYRWLRGELRPSEAHMIKIVTITDGKVTPNDFYDIPVPQAEAAA